MHTVLTRLFASEESSTLCVDALRNVFAHVLIAERAVSCHECTHDVLLLAVTTSPNSPSGPQEWHQYAASSDTSSSPSSTSCSSSQQAHFNLDRDVVVAPDGVLRIAEAIKASWAGKLEIATKELYREGGKKDGVLARVPEESMAAYVSRRRRWYRSLTTLDKMFSIPEHLQLEMVMDCAGITDHQQQLARLAATNPLTLETMSLALVQEYPLIHDEELSRGRERPHPVRRPLPHRPSGRFQPGRSPVSLAYWSMHHP